METMEVRLRGPGISGLLELPRDLKLERIKADLAREGVAIPKVYMTFYCCDPETEERIGDKLKDSVVTVADAAANGFLYVMDSRPPAPVAGGGAAAGGAVPAGDGSVGDLTLAQLAAKQAQQDAKLARLEAQQAAVDAELLPVLQKGLFTVLDKEDQPVCCGFFVTDSGVALTVRHGWEEWLRDEDVVHAVMLKVEEADDAAASGAAAAGGSAAGGAAGAAPDEVLLVFRVHSFSPENVLDYTCMILTSAVPAGTFQPLALPTTVLRNKDLIGAHATLLHGSIAYNRFFDLDPSASLVACSIFNAHPTRVLYTAATAGGDSGGSLVLSGKVLVAMHVEGLNDVPSHVEVVSPTTGKGKRRAVKRLRLSEASPTTVGAALRLDLPAVRAAVQAAHAAAQPAGAAAGPGGEM